MTKPCEVCGSVNEGVHFEEQYKQQLCWDCVYRRWKGISPPSHLESIIELVILRDKETDK